MDIQTSEEITTNIEVNEIQPDKRNTNYKNYIFIGIIFLFILMFIYTRPKTCEPMTNNKVEIKDKSSIPDHANILAQKIQDFNTLQMQSIASL